MRDVEMWSEPIIVGAAVAVLCGIDGNPSDSYSDFASAMASVGWEHDDAYYVLSDLYNKWDHGNLR